MKIHLRIDQTYTRPEIHLCAPSKTEEVQELHDFLLRALSGEMTLFTDYGAERVLLEAVICFYAQGQKVCARTTTQTYTVRQRLYELEESLPPSDFIRISNSEIVNIHKIRRLDTSLTGTIRMQLAGDVETYVSRRYVTKIKKSLGL